MAIYSYKFRVLAHVIEALAKQGGPAVFAGDQFNACQYFEPTSGRKCAIGVFITPGAYNVKMEGGSVDTLHKKLEDWGSSLKEIVLSDFQDIDWEHLYQIGFLSDLQKLHDDHDNWYTNQDGTKMWETSPMRAAFDRLIRHYIFSTSEIATLSKKLDKSFPLNDETLS